MYVVEHADLAEDGRIYELHALDLKTGADQVLATGRWIEKVRAIPASHDWSALMERGQGVQLYRITAKGDVTPLLVNSEVALYGGVADAVATTAMDPALYRGVLDYGWASGRATALVHATDSQNAGRSGGQLQERRRLDENVSGRGRWPGTRWRWRERNCGFSSRTGSQYPPCASRDSFSISAGTRTGGLCGSPMRN